MLFHLSYDHYKELKRRNRYLLGPSISAKLGNVLYRKDGDTNRCHPDVGHVEVERVCIEGEKSGFRMHSGKRRRRRRPGFQRHRHRRRRRRFRSRVVRMRGRKISRHVSDGGKRDVPGEEVK